MKISLKSIFVLLILLCCLFAVIAWNLQRPRYPNVYVADGVLGGSRNFVGASLAARNVELQDVIDMVANAESVDIAVSSELSRLRVKEFKGSGKTYIDVLQELCGSLNLKLLSTGKKEYAIEQE